MPSSFTLPILGAALVAAVAGGVHLGESTVGLIDPIHFQGPAIHPRDRGAAIDETETDPPQPGFASLYGWSEGRAARSQDCGDCEAISARDAYVERNAFVEYEQPVRIHRAAIETWEEPALVTETIEVADGAEEPRHFDVEMKERVSRYAYYEIESEEAPATDDAAESE